MKKFNKTAFTIAFVISFTGCATMRRHPLVTGVIVATAVALPVGLLTRTKQCSSLGGKYNGTPDMYGHCPTECGPEGCYYEPVKYPGAAIATKRH